MADKIADWSSRKQRHDVADLKGLPANVREAILDVEAHSHGIAERVALAEALPPEHPLALVAGEHNQTSWAMRYEVVDGTIVEITKEAHDQPVKLVYRPDLHPAGEVDPASALEASLRGPDANG